MNKQYAQNFQIYVELIREIYNILARFGSKSFSECTFYTGNIPSENMTFSLGLDLLSFFLLAAEALNILCFFNTQSQFILTFCTR
jgi:hypothetical protein